MSNPALLGPDGRPIASDLETRASMDSIVTEMFLRGLTVSQNAVNLSNNNAFERQAWVFACVNVIGRIVSTIPFTIVDPDTGKQIEPRGPREKAAIDRLRNPSPGKSVIELIFSLISHAELTGNGLAWMQGSTDIGGPIPPLRIIPINPNAVEMLQSEGTYEPTIYRYHPTVGSYRKSIDIPANAVLHLRYFNPNNPWWGVGALQAAMLAARTDMKAAVYNERFFENSAQPGGLLLHKRPLTKTQQEAVLKQFNEEYGGERNSHRTAVISGDWSYQQVGLSQRDMDFLAQRNFSRDQIAACFGVPGILINDPNNSNYSTASIEMRLFADTNWLPKVRLLEGVLDAQYFARFAPRIGIRFKVDEAPGLREAFNDKLEQARLLYQMGVPFEDINARLMLEFKPQDHYKYWWIPISMVPADAETARGLQQIQNDKSILQEQQQQKKASEASTKPSAAQKGPGGPSTKAAPIEKPPQRSGADIDRLIEARRRRYWAAVSHDAGLFVSAAESKLRRYLFDARRRALASIRSKNGVLGINLENEVAELATILTPVMLGAYGEAARNITADIGVDVRLVEPTADQVLAATVPFLAIPQIAATLVAAGDDADQIKRAFSVVSNHARRLALAQWPISAQIVRMQTMGMLGVRECMWISRRDANAVGAQSCAMHFDGEIQNIGSVVDVNGLTIEDYSTCRCVALPLPHGVDNESNRENPRGAEIW